MGERTFKASPEGCAWHGSAVTEGENAYQNGTILYRVNCRVRRLGAPLRFWFNFFRREQALLTCRFRQRFCSFHSQRCLPDTCASALRLVVCFRRLVNRPYLSPLKGEMSRSDRGVIFRDDVGIVPYTFPPSDEGGGTALP